MIQKICKIQQLNYKIGKQLQNHTRFVNSNLKKQNETDLQTSEQQKEILTKKQIRKAQEKEEIDQIKNYETIVEQKELTMEKLQDISNQRKKQLLEIAQQVDIPKDALITLALLTAPLAVSPFILNYLCFQGAMLSSIPKLSIMYAKYCGLQVCFGAGIHWGFAMSMHEVQFDSIRSSGEAKQQFLLSVLPIFSTIAMMNTLCYTPQAPVEIKITSIGLLAALFGYNLFLDRRVVNNKQAPEWYFNLKLYITLAALCGLGGFAFLYHEYPQHVLETNYDPLRQHIPNQSELLKTSLKLSEQKTNTQEISNASK